MSTETTSVHNPNNNITVPIHATLELDHSFWNGAQRTSLPVHLGTPEVNWGFDGNKIETRVELTINGESREVAFWDTDQDGTLNTAVHGFGQSSEDPWADLEAADYWAALKWGAGVHARIVHAAEQVTVAAAGRGSEAYNAVVEFATGHSVDDPSFVVHELGEDSERWLVAGTDADTHPSRVKTEVGKWLVEMLGIDDGGLASILENLKGAELTFRDDWVWVPVDPAHPDDECLLKCGQEADHALPRFAATLVNI